ncbi:hypothetical protein ACFXTO_045792 [Malus domestica]
MSFQIILGSALAARRTILAEMGYHFTVVTADIDEKKLRPKQMLLFQGSKVRIIEWGCSCYTNDYCRHGG